MPIENWAYLVGKKISRPLISTKFWIKSSKFGQDSFSMDGSVVVSCFLVHPYLGKMSPFWFICFKGVGKQPPTWSIWLAGKAPNFSCEIHRLKWLVFHCHASDFGGVYLSKASKTKTHITSSPSIHPYHSPPPFHPKKNLSPKHLPSKHRLGKSKTDGSTEPEWDPTFEPLMKVILGKKGLKTKSASEVSWWTDICLILRGERGGGHIWKDKHRDTQRNEMCVEFHGWFFHHDEKTSDK